MSKMRSRRVRIIGMVSALLLLLIAAPVVYGGLRWSGMDPVVRVNGVTYNIHVAVPPDKWCSVKGPINVVVHTPKGASVELISETTGGPEGCKVSSQTFFRTSFASEKKTGEVFATVKVRSIGKEQFPVEALLQSGGSETLCAGRTNQRIVCGKGGDWLDPDTTESDN